LLYERYINGYITPLPRGSPYGALGTPPSLWGLKRKKGGVMWTVNFPGNSRISELRPNSGQTTLFKKIFPENFIFILKGNKTI